MRTMHKLPIALFVIVLLHPLIAWLAGRGELFPLQENRVLAERPLLVDHFTADDFDFLGYTSQLNNWFSDKFPLRAFWVRVRTQLLFSIFSESDKVHVGKDDWLFYRSVTDLELPQFELPSILTYRQKYIDMLVRLSELLNERGVILYVLPLTTKDRYYPEYLPAAAAHALQFHFYDTFMDELIARGKVNVIDSRPILQQAKLSGVKIFHQTDFHWTDAASVEVLKPLLSALSAASGVPDVSAQWQHERIIVSDYIGGEAYAMPLLRTPSETTMDVRLLSTSTLFDTQYDAPGLEMTGIASPGQATPLSPVLVFGDSFFDAGFRAGFFNFFPSFARARLFQQPLLDAYRNRLPGTRFLILENIMSGTFGMYNNVEELLAALEADPAL